MKQLEHRRVCLLVDIDSFSVQVLQKSFAAETVGKPCIVAYTGEDVNIKLTAINYEAKAAGILRSDTVQEAVKKCPDVNVIRFPALKTDPTKSDTSAQEQATRHIVDAALGYCNGFKTRVRPILHVASIDEFYLDVTALVDSRMQRRANVAAGPAGDEGETRGTPEEIDGLTYKFIVEDADGPSEMKHWKPKGNFAERLFCGVKIASEVIRAVRDKTGLTASVGIGTSKLMAKLACGLNKPAAVTVVLPDGYSQASKRVPISCAPGLGGVAGKAIMRELKIVRDNKKGEVPVEYLGDLITFTMDQIASIRLKEDGIKLIGTENGQNIYNTIHGIDDSPVTLKLKPF